MEALPPKAFGTAKSGEILSHCFCCEGDTEKMNCLLGQYRKKVVVSWLMEFWIASKEGGILVSSGNENLNLEMGLRHFEAKLRCRWRKGSLQAGDWNAEAQEEKD